MPTFAGSLKPLRTVSDFVDFRELIDYCIHAYRDKTAFIVKKLNAYTHISYAELGNDIRALGISLIRLGWDKKRIALIGSNTYEWMLVYLATLSIGGTIIPLDKGLPYEEFELSIKRSAADIIFYGRDYDAYISKLDSDSITSISMLSEDLDSLLRSASFATDEELYAYKNVHIDPSRPSIYIFTSGTTSNAKAVMLSQRNILSNIRDLAQAEDIRSNDVNIAFLPYHHTFGGTGQILMLRMGATTVFCDGLKYVQKNLVEYGVSVFIGVPLLIESMYKRIMTAARKNGLEHKLLLATRFSNILLKLGIDIRRKLFKSVIDSLGGKLRLVITGAAAISPEAVIGMTSLGIDVIQGYGMTEASPVIAAENINTRRAGSIGKSLPSVQVKLIDTDYHGVGELAAKGPNVMLGYMDDDENTAQVLQDGWLHTGDLAYIDRNGYIFLRGRKKNVIVLKNGKNVYPEEIEKLLDELPYVTESLVYAKPRKESKDSATSDDLILVAKLYCEGHTSEDIRSQAEADIESINTRMPKYKRIHRLIICENPMAKTTTGKIKRYQEI